MGLPLYVAPVKSDLRNKISASRSCNSHGPNRVRRPRRDTEVLIESRRRAILAAATAAVPPSLEDDAESQRALNREHQQRLNETLQSAARRHMQNSLRSSTHLARPRETLLGPISNPSRSRETATPEVPHPGRESLLRQFYARLREREQSSDPLNQRREQNTATATSTASPTASDSVPPIAVSSSNASSAPSATLRPMATSQVNATRSNTGLRDEQRSWYDYAISNSRLQATTDIRRHDVHYEGAGASPTASLNRLENNGVEERQDILATAQEPGLSSSERLSSRSDSPLRRHPHPSVERRTAEGTLTGSDVESNAAGVRESTPTSRRASSLRSVMNASATSRLPNVGWSDDVRPPSRSFASSQSHVFGDARQVPSADGRLPSDHGWMDGFPDMNGDWHAPTRQEDGRRSLNSPPTPVDDWAFPVEPLDGLGDRRRSPSPYVGSGWNVFLTTLTPDPQPSSVGPPLASTSASLGPPEARTTWLSSPQPTVAATRTPSESVQSPVEQTRDDNEPGASHVHTPPIPLEAPLAWFTEERIPPLATISESTRVPPHLIRSPRVSASVGTNTSDGFVIENVVHGEATFEDSEMDDGMHTDGEDEDAGCDEDEEGEAGIRDFYMGMADRLSGEDARLLRLTLAGARAGNNLRGHHGNISNNNTSQETLDILGIGGMQHIVRSLARREDIPDEWWAEAGLSRTLAREASR
ncbi:hypothetical protein SEPCBS119000_003398 [Sporothrix epigloea]|uniref:Uncharacterized protein n=1 Tax=Sporothrix epigloea TaxID=1892477 RepID=A0ABP0DLF3_9PEZI